jgi:hypothetical protein
MKYNLYFKTNKFYQVTFYVMKYNLYFIEKSIFLIMRF